MLLKQSWFCCLGHAAGIASPFTFRELVEKWQPMLFRINLGFQFLAQCFYFGPPFTSALIIYYYINYFSNLFLSEFIFAEQSGVVEQGFRREALFWQRFVDCN